MNIPIDMPRLKGFCYPREIIAYAVWACHRLTLSTADVEDLLAARGVIVSREAIRLLVNRFGQHFADCIRRDRPRSHDKWHMDEVVIMIRGKKHRLWRAIDADGDVIDILVQSRRNAKAAKRFFKRLLGAERVVPNYNVMGVAKAALESSVRHLAHNLAPQGVTVNAISAGPIKTLAASRISGLRSIIKWNAMNAPLQRNTTIEEVGDAALFCLSDLGHGMTGEILHIDNGYHTTGVVAPSRREAFENVMFQGTRD